MPNLVINDIIDILTIKFNSNKYKNTNQLYYTYLMERLKLETGKTFTGKRAYDNIYQVVNALYDFQNFILDLRKVNKSLFSYGIDENTIHVIIHRPRYSMTAIINTEDEEKRVNVKGISFNVDNIEFHTVNHTIYYDDNKNTDSAKELEYIITASIIEYILTVIDTV